MFKYIVLWTLALVGCSGSAVEYDHKVIVDTYDAGVDSNRSN